MAEKLKSLKLGKNGDRCNGAEREIQKSAIHVLCLSGFPYKRSVCASPKKKTFAGAYLQVGRHI
jgi:hypothetical protein